MSQPRGRHDCDYTKTIFKLTKIVKLALLLLLTCATLSCSGQSSIGCVYGLKEQDPDYLWVCGDNGIVRWHIGDESFTRFDTKCRDILIDDDNNVWAVSEKTIRHYDGDSWHIYALGNGALQGWYITSIYVDSDQNIWVGTVGEAGVLYRYDAAASSWQVVVGMDVPPTPSNTTGTIDEVELEGIYTVFQSLDGAIWVGTSQGVLRLNDMHLAWTEADGLSNDSVRSLAESPDGTVWIGTGDGISRWDGKRWQAWLNPAGDPDPDGDVVSEILAAKNGVIWAVADESVLRLSGEIWQAYHLNRGNIYDIQETSDGKIWLATQEGILHWSGNEWHTYSLGGPGTNSVHTLLVDSQGRLWAGTAQGDIYCYEATTDLWNPFPSRK